MNNETSPYYTLITGASSGIGHELAKECAGRGHNLFLIALPGNGFVDFVKGLKQHYGVEVDYLVEDLTLSDTPVKVYNYAKNKGLKINILINNAGNGHVGKFEVMNTIKVEEMIHLNLRALTIMTLLFIKDMETYTNAHILNVGSLGAYTPVAYKTVYMATKSFVYYFTQSLRQEYRHSKIKFSVLMPGAVITNPEVELRIKKAGFLGRVSALTPQCVAKYTIHKMDKGKFAIMPGTINRLIFNVSAFLPSGILLYITRQVFRKTD
ncbi:MAG: SDR family NAD(P)-dependent oxidoreductase [Sphingobacteriia bacterium]|nr:SDR family NAD(P)-dependent oxidoreductase [Sphingobacteriia bacterium]